MGGSRGVESTPRGAEQLVAAIAEGGTDIEVETKGGKTQKRRATAVASRKEVGPDLVELRAELAANEGFAPKEWPWGYTKAKDEGYDARATLRKGTTQRDSLEGSKITVEKKGGGQRPANRGESAGMDATRRADSRARCARERRSERGRYTTMRAGLIASAVALIAGATALATAQTTTPTLGQDGRCIALAPVTKALEEVVRLEAVQTTVTLEPRQKPMFDLLGAQKRLEDSCAIEVGENSQTALNDGWAIDALAGLCAKHPNEATCIALATPTVEGNCWMHTSEEEDKTLQRAPACAQSAKEWVRTVRALAAGPGDGLSTEDRARFKRWEEGLEQLWTAVHELAGKVGETILGDGVETKSENTDTLADTIAKRPESEGLERRTRSSSKTGGALIARHMAEMEGTGRIPVSTPPSEGRTHAMAVPGAMEAVSPGSADHVTLDPDVAGWPWARQTMSRGGEIWPGAVKVEEWVHYFEVGRSRAQTGGGIEWRPALIAAPWAPATRWLLRIGVHTGAKREERPLAITWLVDRSGSMGDGYPHTSFNRIAQAIGESIEWMEVGDSFALVSYAGDVRIEQTATMDTAQMHASVARLRAAGTGGGTGGARGLATAWKAADGHPVGYRQIVIVGTDGDFNIGTADARGIEHWAKGARESARELRVLLTGRTHVREEVGAALAANANGQLAYLDGTSEAVRTMRRWIGDRPEIAARDVKLRFEPNPSVVAEWRRVGLERNIISAEAFLVAETDGGELPAGDAASAWYELIPCQGMHRSLPPSRYAQDQCAPGEGQGENAWRGQNGEVGQEIGVVTVRWKDAEGGVQTATVNVEADAALREATDDPDTAWLAHVVWAASRTRNDPGIGEDSWSAITQGLGANLGSPPTAQRSQLHAIAGEIASRENARN